MLTIYELDKMGRDESLNCLYYAKDGNLLYIADPEKITIWVTSNGELGLLDDYFQYEWLGMFRMEYGDDMNFKILSKGKKDIPPAVRRYHKA